MGLDAVAGSFLTPTVTGNLPITGLNVAPGLVLFWATNATADGQFANSVQMVGAAVSSSNRTVSYFANPDNVAPLASFGAGATNLGCIQLADVNNNVIIAADFVSMDALGFTVNFTTVSATQYVINYLALGGSSLTNAATAAYLTNLGAGNQSVTGTGFQPDVTVIFTDNYPTTMPSTAGPPRPNYGVALSSSNRFEVNVTLTRQATTTGAVCQQDQTGIEHELNGTGSTLHQMDFVSQDANGFTVNQTTAPGQGYFFYLCIKGPRMAIGSITQPTTTGPQAISGLGFRPGAVLFFTDNFPASATFNNNARYSVGAATASGQRWAQWSGCANGVSTTVERSYLTRTHCIAMATEQVGGVAVNATADLVGMDGDGFTLNWDAVDATTRQIYYWAFGPGEPFPAGYEKNAGETTYLRM